MKNPGARNSEVIREKNANIPHRKPKSFGKERTRSEGFPETAAFGATLQMSGRRKEKRMNPKALETEGLWQDYETSGVKGGAEPQAGEKTLPGHSVAAAPGQERRRRRGGGGAARGGGRAPSASGAGGSGGWPATSFFRQEQRGDVSSERLTMLFGTGSRHTNALTSGRRRVPKKVNRGLSLDPLFPLPGICSRNRAILPCIRSANLETAKVGKTRKV